MLQTDHKTALSVAGAENAPSHHDIFRCSEEHHWITTELKLGSPTWCMRGGGKTVRSCCRLPRFSSFAGVPFLYISSISFYPLHPSCCFLFARLHLSPATNERLLLIKSCATFQIQKKLPDTEFLVFFSFHFFQCFLLSPLFLFSLYEKAQLLQYKLCDY